MKMKKFILAIMALIILVLATLVLFDALTMKSEAAQVGVRITQSIPQHNHLNQYQGGVLYSNFDTVNLGFGFQSLYSITSGSYNIGFGHSSLKSTTTGSVNVAIGYRSLYSNTTGQYNNAVGYDALYSNTSGYSNAALGTNALYSNTTGQYNNAVGHESLRAMINGYSNNAVGSQALYSSTGGQRNVAIGDAALRMNVTGSDNVAIGTFAGYSETGSNKLYIANQDNDRPLIGGDFDLEILTVNGQLRTTMVTKPTATCDAGIVLGTVTNSTDNSGRFGVTAVGVTECTLFFNVPRANAPFCVANLNSSTLPIYTSSTTKTQAVFTFGATTDPVITYICL
jgi:hypothetical protein